MAELELLTYWSCYLYARATKSVSYATPTYYAHVRDVHNFLVSFGLFYFYSGRPAGGVPYWKAGLKITNSLRSPKPTLIQTPQCSLFELYQR